MSKKLKEYVLKTYTHPVLGKVEVLRVVPKSRTLLEVQVVDKGEGWNQEKKKYTGIRKGSGWVRGQNYDEGHIDEVHHKDLTKFIEDED